MPITSKAAYVICLHVCIDKLPPDTLPPWRQFGWRQFGWRQYDLRPELQGNKDMAKYSISRQGEACPCDVHSPTTVIKLMELSLHSLVLLECDEGATVRAMKCPPTLHSALALPIIVYKQFCE